MTLTFVGSMVSFLYLGSALAVVVALPFLFWRRRRDLSGPCIARWREGPPPELDSTERRALTTWHRCSVAGFGFTIVCLVSIVIASAMGWSGDAITQIALVALLGCVGVGVYHQFSRRCPRCRMNIGLQSRLGLPARCERCHVRFKEG